MRIRRYDIASVLPDLPDIKELNADVLSKRSWGAYICALGFEPRCLTIPEALARAGFKSDIAICLKYSTNADQNQENWPRLEAALTSMSPRIVEVEVDSPSFPIALYNALELIDCTGSVCFDVTVVANRAAVTCMTTLLELDVELAVAYGEADVYHPTKAEYERDPGHWQADESGLEAGVSRVVPSVSHAGQQLDTRPNSVIVFPSFKPARARALISHIDPALMTTPESNVVWMLGIPHLDENRWRLDAMRAINGIDEKAVRYQVSTFDYKDTLRTLERVYAERWEENNISVASIGSKLQSLACALFAFLHPDVSVICASPRRYNAKQYSGGCREMWCIGFGQVSRLRDTLLRTGSIEIDAGPITDEH